MAIFQPSNVIPSTFASFGLGTIDVNSDINLSWQVNGNSPLTAYQIKIYDNNQNTTTPIYIGEITPVSPAFYGVDNKGNRQQFTPNIEGTWSSLGLSNGNEYLIEITQWWGSDISATSSTQVTQWSGSVFLTRSTPSLNITLNGADFNSSVEVESAIVTFGANYSQEQGDSVNSIRWQFGKYSGNQIPVSNILDNEVNILDDTGFINTSVFEYTYNGLLPHDDNGNMNVYVVKCTVETQNGVQEPTDWIAFYVNYEEAISSNTLTAKCMEDDSILVSWDKAIDIPGVLSPSGTPTINDGQLVLSSGQSVEWNTVDGEAMDFKSPWSLVCKKNITIQEINKNANTTVQNQSVLYPITRTESTDLIYLAPVFKSETYQESIGVNHFKPTTSSGRFVGGYSTSNGKGYIIEHINNEWVATETSNHIVSITKEYGASFYYALANRGDCYVWVNSSLGWSTTGFTLPYSNTGDYINIEVDGYVYVASKTQIFIVKGSTVTTAPISIETNDSFIGIKDNLAVTKLGRVFDYNYALDQWSEKSSISGIGNIADFCVHDGTRIMVVGEFGYSFSSNRGESWVRKYAPSINASQVIYAPSGPPGNQQYYLVLSRSNNKIYTISKPNLTFCVSNYETNLMLLTSSSSGYSNSYYYEFDMAYYYENTYTSSAWIKTVNFDVNTSYLNFNQSYLNQAVIISAVTETLNSNISAEVVLVNNIATKQLKYDFELGKIKRIQIANITPLEASITSSFNNSTYSLIITTPISNANVESVNVSYDILIQYEPNDWYVEYPVGNLININNNSVLITSEQQNGVVRYLLNYGSYGSIYLPQQLNGNNFSLLFGITESELKILLINETNNYLMNETIDYTQESISSLQLIGPQVVDYLYLQSGNISDIDNFTPNWTADTLFYANFSNSQDALQAGTLSTSGEILNSLYRKDDNGNLTFIGNFPTNITEVKDYWIKSGESYSYEMFYLSVNSGYSTPTLSNSVCKRFSAYTLIEAEQDSVNPNTYHVVKVWRFANNISAGSVSNNNAPNWLTNFTPYRLKQPSSRLGKSGTLQALLYNYNLSENFYQDTTAMMDRLYQASASNNAFFLKDMKGNLYMVGISAPIVQTINTKTKVQEVKVSIPWEEVGDASNVSLIQLPTDEGYSQDEVFDVIFNVDFTNGMLSVTYPNNYMGTTFELQNSSLISTTPSGINGADLAIVDGALIASEKE